MSTHSNYSTKEKPRWYVKPSICKPCGGRCCKNFPGSAYPEDFPTREELLAALDSGRWAIDWWEGDARKGKEELNRTYYVRPAIKGHEGRRHHAGWGGECTFLTGEGCSLVPDARPRECRQLDPMADGKCEVHDGTSKQGAAVAWLARAGELVSG